MMIRMKILEDFYRSTCLHPKVQVSACPLLMMIGQLITREENSIALVELHWKVKLKNACAETTLLCQVAAEHVEQ